MDTNSRISKFLPRRVPLRRPCYRPPVTGAPRGSTITNVSDRVLISTGNETLSEIVSCR